MLVDPGGDNLGVEDREENDQLEVLKDSWRMSLDKKMEGMKSTFHGFQEGSHAAQTRCKAGNAY